MNAPYLMFVRRGETGLELCVQDTRGDVFRAYPLALAKARAMACDMQRIAIDIEYGITIPEPDHAE